MGNEDRNVQLALFDERMRLENEKLDLLERVEQRLANIELHLVAIGQRLPCDDALRPASGGDDDE